MFKNYSLLLIYIMIIEILFRFISGVQIFDTSLLRILLGANVLALIIAYLASFLGKISNKILIILCSLFFSIYAFLQLGFNNFIGVYMSFNTSSQLGAVTDYVREFFGSFYPKYYFMFIPFLLICLYYIFIDKHLNYKGDKKFVLKKGRYETVIKTVMTVFFVGLSGFLYYKSLTVDFMQDDLQMIKTIDLFKSPSVPSTAVDNFGILGFGLLDIKTVYTGLEDIPVVYANQVKHKTSRSFDDSTWEEVISKEKDSTYKTINNYLINNSITDYNDYTGLFKDKNLIVIMMESVNDIFINEEYYPNFYKMYSEGWHFTNNYSPRNSCSTGNNEFSAMTGLYSIYNNCTANVYKDNTYSTSLFNLFNRANYKTSSMHDYTENYYYRRTIHKNLGSGKYYGVEDLGIDYSSVYREWASDEDFMKVAMDITLDDPKEPFMLWLTSVSSHQPYKVSSTEGDKYLEYFEDTDYPMDLQRYMSKLKTLDNALGILLDRLEKAKILDDTVIVMFGDHYPYGLSNETINNVLTYDLDNYEVERTPFVIYNSELEAKSYDMYTSYVNITPTLANLFDLNYDPRLYMGSDIFSPDYFNVVAYADGSWKNKSTYYNAKTSEVISSQNDMSQGEIKNINAQIASKMQISSMIIKNNYFAYLDQAKEDVLNDETLAARIPEEEE